MARHSVVRPIGEAKQKAYKFLLAAFAPSILQRGQRYAFPLICSLSRESAHHLTALIHSLSTPRATHKRPATTLPTPPVRLHYLTPRDQPCQNFRPSLLLPDCPIHKTLFASTLYALSAALPHLPFPYPPSLACRTAVIPTALALSSPRKLAPQLAPLPSSQLQVHHLPQVTPTYHHHRHQLLHATSSVLRTQQSCTLLQIYAALPSTETLPQWHTTQFVDERSTWP